MPGQTIGTGQRWHDDLRQNTNGAKYFIFRSHTKLNQFRIVACEGDNRQPYRLCHSSHIESRTIRAYREPRCLPDAPLHFTDCGDSSLRLRHKADGVLCLVGLSWHSSSATNIAILKDDSTGTARNALRAAPVFSVRPNWNGY